MYTMSTRRTASSSSNSTAANLPTPRERKGIRPVQKPLSSTRLSRLIYLLVFLSALLTAFYSWRAVQYKSAVGGWWNLATGRRVPQIVNKPGEDGKIWRRKGKKEEDSVEDRINALAEALGMPSKDLASAIAVAVREHIPPASLSSVKAKETGSGVINELVGDEEEAGGIAASVVSGMESIVGMDEPIEMT